MSLLRYLKLSLLCLALCGAATLWLTPVAMQYLWSLEFFQKNPFLTWALFGTPLVFATAALLGLSRVCLQPLAKSAEPYWLLRFFAAAFGLCILTLVGSAAFLPQSLATLKIACIVLGSLWAGLVAFCAGARLAIGRKHGN